MTGDPEGPGGLRTAGAAVAISGRAQARLGEVCRISRRHFSCPTALVSTSARLLMRGTEAGTAGSLVDGIDASFAEHVIETGERLVVLDARADPRFGSDFLVTAYPFIRFYAGAPIRLSSGGIAGVLSLIDYAPRDDFAADEEAVLSGLANLAAGEIESTHVHTARVRETAHVRAVAARSSLAVIEIDGKGRISHFNEAARRLLISGDASLTHVPAGQHVPAWDVLEEQCRLALFAGDADLDVDTTLDIRLADGRVVPAQALCSTWIENGEICHRLVIEPAG